MRHIRTIFIALGAVFAASVTTPISAHAHNTSVLEQLREETVLLVERLAPAVVTIYANQYSSESGKDDPGDNTNPENNGDNRKPQGNALGSGFILTYEGHVVTNHHVIAGAAEDGVGIVLRNDEKVRAKILGSDPYSDIAFLKMDIGKWSFLKRRRAFEVVGWGSSEALKQGESVIAIGAPFGLKNTVTKGIVSKVNRYHPSNETPVIQHDAAINKGNSGGPLFNIYGEVVGLNTSIISRDGTNSGVTFAVPSDIARRVVVDLEQFGRVKRGFIGIGVRDLLPDIAEELGLPNSNGVLVATVTSGEPADIAGIRKNDVMLSWDDVPTKNVREMLQIVARATIGAAAQVKVWRNGKTEMFWVMPTERPRTVDEMPAFPPPPKKPEEE